MVGALAPVRDLRRRFSDGDPDVLFVLGIGQSPRDAEGTGPRRQCWIAAAIAMKPQEIVLTVAGGVTSAMDLARAVVQAGLALCRAAGAGACARRRGHFLRVGALSSIARRLEQFITQLELALRLIASGIRVGLALRQALTMVTEELADPARHEFLRVIGQTNIGVSVLDALDDLAVRMPTNETLMMARVIRIQSQSGGDLAKVLDQLAATIKDRRQVHRKIGALTAEGRMSALVLMIIPLALGAFILTTQPTMAHALLYTGHGACRDRNALRTRSGWLFLADARPQGERLVLLVYLIPLLVSLSAFLLVLSLIPAKSALSEQLDALKTHEAERVRRKTLPSSAVHVGAPGALRRQLAEAGWYTVTPAQMGLRVVAGLVLRRSDRAALFGLRCHCRRLWSFSSWCSALSSARTHRSFCCIKRWTREKRRFSAPCRTSWT